MTQKSFQEFVMRKKKFQNPTADPTDLAISIVDLAKI